MLKHATIFAGAIFATVISSTAEAQQRPRSTSRNAAIVCDLRGCSETTAPNRARTARSRARRDTAVASNDNTVVIGGRPAGCPHQYCGCEASRHVFGKIRPELNLASNWIKYFPRTAPAPGMAAARSGHVMVLVQHVDGDNWIVHDGNSGGGLTRRHVRSIRGHVVVNPHATRTAIPSSSKRQRGASGMADASAATQRTLSVN